MRGFVRSGAVALAALFAVCALTASVEAGTPVLVPEIDASVVPAALGLVTAGVLMLRARRGSK